jgi:hypothetical protein
LVVPRLMSNWTLALAGVVIVLLLLFVTTRPSDRR